MTTAIANPGLKAGHQIADLRRLQNGWRNGEGIAFNAGYLAWLSDAFTRMYPSHAPAPAICPTTYGVVSAEWTLSGVEVSLEIDPDTRQGDLVWASGISLESGETEVDLTNAKGWTRLAEYLAIESTGIAQAR